MSMLGDSSLAPEGCASSLGRRLVDRGRGGCLMLESTYGPWWSCNRSESIAMFRRELLILDLRTLFGWPQRIKLPSLGVDHFVPQLALRSSMPTPRPKLGDGGAPTLPFGRSS
ncbi:hypothetical protein BHE74_00050387 [Ensete ventricosum]|nr:hypothetical protein BHE74_00050387 [Ensete ventricosum]